jgi:hypothetical protein
MRGVSLAYLPTICALSICLPSCQERQTAEQKPHAAGAAPSAQATQPRQRTTLPFSAYGVRIDFEGDTLVLASAKGLRLYPATGPASEVARDFGDTFALAGARVVYFDAGRILVSLRGAEPKALARVAERPRSIAVDREHVAWVSSGADGPSVLWSLGAEAPRELAKLEGRVDALVLASDWVFFLEQGRSGTWRLGGVPREGGTPAFQDWRSGRMPSTLVAHGDLFYYDGPSRSVLRTSPDLASSEVLAQGVICSPLAVADRVLCARVGGVYELPSSGGVPKDLFKQGAFVTALAARDHEIAWVSDLGADRLLLERRSLH